MLFSARILLTLGVCLGGMPGCADSGASFSVTPLRGKVVVNGTPASAGIVTMAPVSQSETKGDPGKPAVALIENDGTFTMTTYQPGDGVIVGKLEVSAGSADEDKPWPTTLSAPIPFESNRKISAILIEIEKNGQGKIRPLP